MARFFYLEEKGEYGILQEEYNFKSEFEVRRFRDYLKDGIKAIVLNGDLTKEQAIRVKDLQ